MSINSSIVITRPFKFIVKNDSNENNFDINHSKNVSNRKILINKRRSISTFKTFKENKIQKFNLIDIVEIDAFAYYYLIKNKENKIQKFNLIDIVEINAFAYYYLIKNKENKLFSLTINEIYDTFIQFSEIRSQTK